MASSAQRRLVLFRQNVRLIFQDPSPVILYLLVPLMMMAIFRPISKVALVKAGYTGANGAEQVIPAFTVMFSFFWVRSIGELFFQEHGWRTWERLQSTAASAFDIVLGKLASVGMLIVIQFSLLIPVSALLFDLHSEGPVLPLALLSLSLLVCILSLGLALVAVVRSMAAMDTIATMLTLLFGTLGGAFVVQSSLPNIADDISYVTPVYWYMEGWRRVILHGDGLSGAAPPAVVLLLFALAFTALAVARFRVGQAKVVGA